MDPVSVPRPFDDLEDRLLPWSQVKVICGLSRTTVWRLQKTGDFPACVQVSLNRVGWWQSELLAWRRARTPRRLPAPRFAPAPDAPPPERSLKGIASVATAEAAGPAASATRPARRRRKAIGLDNQTAFDFGS